MRALVLKVLTAGFLAGSAVGGGLVAAVALDGGAGVPAEHSDRVAAATAAGALVAAEAELLTTVPDTDAPSTDADEGTTGAHRGGRGRGHDRKAADSEPSPDANHGAEVSEVARDDSLHGCEHGRAVSAVASSKAADHRQGDGHGDKPCPESAEDQAPQPADQPTDDGFVDDDDQGDDDQGDDDQGDDDQGDDDQGDDDQGDDDQGDDDQGDDDQGEPVAPSATTGGNGRGGGPPAGHGNPHN